MPSEVLIALETSCGAGGHGPGTSLPYILIQRRDRGATSVAAPLLQARINREPSSSAEIVRARLLHAAWFAHTLVELLDGHCPVRTIVPLEAA